MRRLNLWIAIPVLIATLAGGLIGFQVTRVSCSGGCVPAATAIGVAAALMAFFGMGTVMILADRSIAEWRQQQDRGGPPPPPRDEPPTC